MAAHRYWAINVKTCAAGVFGALSKVEMATSMGGSNLCVTGASCFAGSDQAGHTADIALLGTSYWGGAGALPVRWWYDFGTPVDIAEVRITSISGLETFHPSTWDLQSSNDAATWVTETPMIAATWVAGAQQVFENTFIAPTAGHHRFWRISLTANLNGGAPGALSEVIMASSIGGATVLSGGSIISSGNNGSVEANAIDGNVNTFWGSPGASLPQWWGYDFGANTYFDIRELRITAGAAVLQYHPTALNLDYSDDAGTWTTRSSFASVPWVAGVTQTFDPTVAPPAAAHGFFRSVF